MHISIPQHTVLSCQKTGELDFHEKWLYINKEIADRK
jgi:hypothetical protein